MGVADATPEMLDGILDDDKITATGARIRVKRALQQLQEVRALALSPIPCSRVAGNPIAVRNGPTRVAR